MPGFATALASAPKQLAPDEAASLLEAVAAHGAEALRAGLLFPELCALLLGPLGPSNPNPRTLTLTLEP